jgi:hypothetical protein
VAISGDDNALTIRVEAKGANAKLSHNAADFLTNAVPSEPIDGHSIQLYYTTLLARECQSTLNVSTSPETVTLAVTPGLMLGISIAATHVADGSGSRNPVASARDGVRVWAAVP